jgi:hypothetical protein
MVLCLGGGAQKSIRDRVGDLKHSGSWMCRDEDALSRKKPDLPSSVEVFTRYEKLGKEGRKSMSRSGMNVRICMESHCCFYFSST